jgi:hypothetical protein
MKRSLVPIALLTLVVSVGSMQAFAKTSAEAASIHGIRVAVDPRLELISIVQYLSGYRHARQPLVTNETSEYRQQVDAWFSRFKDHAAVREFEAMAEKGYSFSRPPVSMLYLDDHFRLRKDLLPDELVFRLSGGPEQLQKFAGLLNAFSRDSDFPKFFAQHRTFYSSLISEVRMNLDQDYVAELEALYGARNASYNVLLVPLYGSVGFGPIVRTKTGEGHVYSIIGPRSVTDGRQRFADRAYFTYLQRHEFSHSFVNPLTSRFSTGVQQTAGLMNLMGVATKKDVCGEWEECLNENVVRAVTTFLAFRDNPEAGQQALQKEVNRGAVLVPEILEALRSYSSARDRYPTLESYYPVLLDRLAKLPTNKTQTP